MVRNSDPLPLLIRFPYSDVTSRTIRKAVNKHTKKLLSRLPGELLTTKAKLTVVRAAGLVRHHMLDCSVCND